MNRSLLNIRLYGDINIKPCPFVQSATCRNNPVVIFNNSFADSEANTSARILVLIMKTLEHFKDAFIVLWLEPSGVIKKSRKTKLSQNFNAGCVLPDITDNYSGKAPDLGALEAGQSIPHYGPRKSMQKKEGCSQSTTFPSIHHSL